jgi:uncharacterized protein YndB with AHSA1/START domain
MEILMTTVTNSYYVSIKAVPEAVFAYVSDLSRHPEWSGGQLKIREISPEPIAVGKEYLSQGEVAGQKDRPNQLRVTEYQPSTRFAFVAKDPDFGDVPHTFFFTPQNGGTLLERKVVLNLSPVTALMFRFFIRPLIGKPMMDKALAAIKAKLEAGVS